MKIAIEQAEIWTRAGDSRDQLAAVDALGGDLEPRALSELAKLAPHSLAGGDHDPDRSASRILHVGEDALA